jgi:DNA polymerase
MKLSIDFESRSLADLSEVGAWNYSLHKSTVVLMCAISADGGKATCFDCRQPDALNVVKLMLQDADEIHAWNVGFEYALITNVLKLDIPLLRFFDTMAKACAFSVPASLGKCGAALNLSIQKDTEGDRLMKLFSMPAKAGKLKGQLRDMTPELESEYARYMDYCRQDVESEMAIGAALPDLTGDDLAFWRTTWITNLRGIPIDMELVTSLQKMVERGEKVIGSAVSERTDGALDGYVLKNNHKKVSKYLDIPSVAKAYVTEVLARADVDPKTRELLEARQALGRTAVAKLPKFKNYASVVDHRVRDAHRFNGAQSGRDTSLGINLMNLPRGAKFDVPKLIACAKADDWEGFFEAAKYHLGKSGPVPVLFDPLGAVVACLRGCIAPKHGVLYQCDYASIEPRVLAWYSGQEWELEAWRKYDAKQGPDLYKVFAGKAWGIEPDAVSGDQRQLGKVGKLAAAYRTGWKTLQTQAKDAYGLILSDAEAQFIIDGYRATHRENVAFWHNTEKAAEKAVDNPGSVYSIGKAAYRFDGLHLQCRLVSGRKITYPYATMETVVHPEYGPKRQLHYMREDGPGEVWRKISTHGGVLTNHIVQGTSGCLLRYACNNLEAAGFKVILRIYDEIVAEMPDASRFDEFQRIILQLPEWAEGLPVSGAGWVAECYKKDG